MQGDGMLAYYLDLGLRSCLRSRALTALVIVLMAVGVAACMLSYAVLRVASSDPMPGRSGRLFAPQIDNFGPARNNRGLPPDQLTYIDAVALQQASRAPRQTLAYRLTLGVVPADPRRQPFPQTGEAVTSDFFAMFDAPFRGALNRKLFSDVDSTGRTLVLDGHDYRIVLGVALAVGANLWLMARGELPRMPLSFALLGALVLWLLGQIAVFGPARRAAAVPPVAAIRM
jgi:putative ABC transport system permease protein